MCRLTKDIVSTRNLINMAIVDVSKRDAITRAWEDVFPNGDEERYVQLANMIFKYFDACRRFEETPKKESATLKEISDTIWNLGHEISKAFKEIRKAQGIDFIQDFWKDGILSKLQDKKIEVNNLETSSIEQMGDLLLLLNSLFKMRVTSYSMIKNIAFTISTFYGWRNPDVSRYNYAEHVNVINKLFKEGNTTVDLVETMLTSEGLSGNAANNLNMLVSFYETYHGDESRVASGVMNCYTSYFNDDENDFVDVFFRSVDRERFHSGLHSQVTLDAFEKLITSVGTVSENNDINRILGKAPINYKARVLIPIEQQ